MGLDRFGEPEDQPPEGGTTEPPAVPHPPGCKDGWLDRDSIPARPCLVCKPHLAPNARTRIH